MSNELNPKAQNTNPSQGQEKPSYFVVIPARYASQRLPGKPLVDIAGKPMIERVYEQAQKTAAEKIIIATDHDEVYRAVQRFTDDVVMTKESHPSGTDRLQEVAEHYGWSDEQIIVNLQGDEPLLPPALIEQVAGNLAQHPNASIATLSTPIEEAEERHNPNAVKVVCDHQGYALYFSRSTIPFDRSGEWSTPNSWFRHLGIYGYRVKFLHQYVHWSPAPIEQLECLEQLRALYQGVKIHVAQAVSVPPVGVDTQEDLEQVRALF